MSNVFLDLGTHYGSGLRHFINRFNIDDTWNVHTFEANPVVFEEFANTFLHLNPYIKSHHAAVSTYNGTITINIETPPGEGDTGMGSSVVSLDKWDPWGNNTINKYFHRSETIPCIDFSSFIKENFSKEDFILIKMVIEGSEYDLLEKMIEDGTIEFVNHLFVEWHSGFFINSDEIRKREANLMSMLTNYSNLKVENWI